MKGQKKNLKKFNINKAWTLFLDRDGIINRHIEGDYVRTWEQFNFVPEFLKYIKILSDKFGRIIITTNQRCVGRKIITERQLKRIHQKMMKTIQATGSTIDKIYYCPHNLEDNCDCRKPKTGMALKAKSDFKNIDFSKSIMVGDSESDMEFGKRLGMITVYVSDSGVDNFDNADYSYPDLHALCEELI